jgi:outer membrane lipoprotein-sorting protein
MKQFSMIFKSVIIFILIVTVFPILGQSPEEKGMQIAIEVDTRDTGFNDTVTELKMILRNKQGQESTRQMQNKTLEVDGDGDKSLVIFNEPRDVKGTAFLSFTHKSDPDDQWLYLPALKRVKRIASNNKSGPFMGSEFAYEDISSQEVEKYTYKYINDDVHEGMDCFVIERYPVDEKSGYRRQIVWYDKTHYRPIKIDFYDRKDSKLKTLLYLDYNQYMDKYWRAGKMSMVNHQTGKSTDLLFNDYQFATGLTDRDFDKNSLKRAR